MIEDQIESVLQSVRPAIQSDGGDVRFVEWNPESGVVSVQLLGACESCPISLMTLKEGIERRVKAVLPQVVEVQAV